VDVCYGSFAIGSPEGALCVAFAGQMGRYYDVPSRAGGSLTDAKVPDAQAGAESMLQLFITIQSGVNLIHHSVGMPDSYSTSSPEKLVIDCESLRYIEHFRDGYDIDTDTLAEDLVEEVDPGGHFLNQRHTLEHSRDDYLFSDFFYRDSYDNWESEGAKDAFEATHEWVEELLAEYKQPELDAETEAKLDAYVEVGIEIPGVRLSVEVQFDRRLLIVIRKVICLSRR